MLAILKFAKPALSAAQIRSDGLQIGAFRHYPKSLPLKLLGFLVSFSRFGLWRTGECQRQPSRKILGQTDTSAAFVAFVSKGYAFSKECFFDLYGCAVVNTPAHFEAKQCILANTSLPIEIFKRPPQRGACHTGVRRGQHGA